MRIAIVGSGISGIAAARTLLRFGHEVVVFEKTSAIGGVWAVAYPGVHLQNTAETYRLSDFPWPFPVEQHPSGADVLKYLEAAVTHFELDIRLNHDVVAMHEVPDGWTLDIDTATGRLTERFDYAVLAVGHYTQERSDIALTGRERFKGDIVTEYDIVDLDMFKDRKVVVLGFGKTAVDMAMFALPRAKFVIHLFRAPRWLLPYRILGKHMVEVITPRSSTALEDVWVHPGKLEARIHASYGWALRPYAKMIDWLVARSAGLKGAKTKAGRERLALVRPDTPLGSQMRGTMAPPGYYDAIGEGRIEPVKGEAAGFTETAMLLKDGRELPADLVVLAVGHKVPDFPYLPEPYRGLMRAETDGTPLYRHIIHPQIPWLAFAGFNHGFFHVPAVELGMIWLGAMLRGDLTLPTSEEMLASAARVHAWKRAHTQFEPTRAYLISGHFHQYFDVLLGDLGVNPYRKKSRSAEINDAYGPADYVGVFDEYEKTRTGQPRPVLKLDT